jgi:hypothetical protein
MGMHTKPFVISDPGEGEGGSGRSPGILDFHLSEGSKTVNVTTYILKRYFIKRVEIDFCPAVGTKV